MAKPCDTIELGKLDAQTFVRNERIDYEPFVAISDIHLVRNTIPPSYQAFQETVAGIDQQLWNDIDASARLLAENHRDAFDYDGYAAGFAAGIAAIWETIRDQVL